MTVNHGARTILSFKVGRDSGNHCRQLGEESIRLLASLDRGNKFVGQGLRLLGSLSLRL